MPMKQLGPKQYGSKDWLSFAAYGFPGGVNIKSSPQELDDGDLTDGTQNVYLRTDGGVESRKGYNLRGSQFSASNGMQGVYRFAQTIINGVPQNPVVSYTLGQQDAVNLVDIDRNTTIASGCFSVGSQPWDVSPMYDPDHNVQPPTIALNNAPTSGGSLAAGTYLFSITYVNASGETTPGPDGTVTVTLNQEFVVLSPVTKIGLTGWNLYLSTVNGNTASELLQNASPIAIGTNYTVSSRNTGQANRPSSNTANAPSDVLIITTGAGGPYIFDGYVVYVPAAYTNASLAGTMWNQVVNNILWFGGIPNQTNLIQGTALGFPEGNPLARLSQPTGLPGYAAFTVSHPVTGLSIIGSGPSAGLVVGMQQGLTNIYGVSPGNYYIQEVPSDDGVASGYAMVSFRGAVYFLGGNAFYFYDGFNNPQITSTKVEPWILNDPRFQDLSMKGNRALYFAIEYNNRIYIIYDNEGAGTQQAGLVLDLTTNGWTPMSFANSFASGCIMNAPGDPYPALMLLSDSILGQAYTFDVYTYSQEAAPSTLTTGSTPGGSLAAATYYIKSTWVTRTGETFPGSEQTQAVLINNLLTVTAPSGAPTDAYMWNLYVSTATGTETLQQTLGLASNYTQPLTGLIVGKLPPSGELHQTSDNGTSIAAQLFTKFFKIGIPGTLKVVTRYYPELFTEIDFDAETGISNNYGASTFNQNIASNLQGGSLWDVALWDVGIWGSAQTLSYLGAPNSRQDVNVRGEAFSFSVLSNGNYSPWIFQGVTGSYVQEVQV